MKPPDSVECPGGQLHLALTHDFVVTIQTTHEIIVRAHSAAGAKAIAEHVLQQDKTEYRIQGVVRADLVERDASYDPDITPPPAPRPPGGRPNGGGTPGAGRPFIPELVNATPVAA